MTDDTVDIWMPIYIGNYAADTMHLSTEEHGAYLLLQMYYWRNGGPIKNDKKLLKNITKISPKKLENILQKFEEKNGYLFHQKLDALLDQATVNKEKRVRKAKDAAAVRWGNEQCSEHLSSIENDEKNDAKTMPKPCPLPLSIRVDTNVPTLITTLPLSAREEKSENEKINEPTKPEPDPPGLVPPPPWAEVGAQVNEILGRYQFLPLNPSSCVTAWLSWDGIDPEIDIYPVVESVCQRVQKNEGNVTKMTYFSGPIKDALRTRLETIAMGSGLEAGTIPIAGNPRLERLAAKVDDPFKISPSVRYMAIEAKRKRGEPVTREDAEFTAACDAKSNAAAKAARATTETGELVGERSVCSCGKHKGLGLWTHYKRAQIYEWERRRGVPSDGDERMLWLASYKEIHGEISDKSEKESENANSISQQA